MDNRELLQIPDGVRDLYGMDCAVKKQLEQSLHSVMLRYGFRDIETPTFEFFPIFGRERGTVSSKDLYKLIDRDGNTLVLRPDFTPSIARCAAKYYAEEELPIRLCYLGNTFLNSGHYTGKLHEVTQLGAELINDDSADADAEMIALAIDILLQSHLPEFQIEIGHAGLFRGLMEEADLTGEEETELRRLIERKNTFGVEAFLEHRSVPKPVKQLLIALPELFGHMDVLERVRDLAKSPRTIDAVNRLQKVYDILDSYGFQQYLTADLGLLSQYDYYTGIIFKGYTFGTGDAIVTGGRYDHLLQQFGKNAPAMGFAVVIDQLLTALLHQHVDISPRRVTTMLLYHGRDRRAAIDLGNQLRGRGEWVQLVRKSAAHTPQEYETFARESGMRRLWYLEAESGRMFLTDLDTGSRTISSLREMLNPEEDKDVSVGTSGRETGNETISVCATSDGREGRRECGI